MKYLDARRFARSAPLGIAAVFSVSFFAYGQLGGAQGIDIPYGGYLQDGSAALSDDAVNFVFTIYDSAGALSPCDTVTAADVAVTDGRFATVIEDVAEACVQRKDPHIEIGVDKNQTGTAAALQGRQRLYPAVGALTSGPGDFDVTGATDTGTLNVRGATTTDSLSVTGLLTANGGATVSGGADVVGGVQSDQAFLGDVGHGPSWGGFSHVNRVNQNEYALLQSSAGQTLLNASSGQTIEFRVANSPKMTMSTTGNLTTRTGTTPGASESLRIVRGTVLLNSTTASVSAGSGFSVSRVAIGVYDISFTTAFATKPSITCTALHPSDSVVGSGSGQCMVAHPNQVGTSSARLFVAAGSGGNADFSFSFIAIGPI
jgi:hypothetical protein